MNRIPTARILCIMLGALLACRPAATSDDTDPASELSPTKVTAPASETTADPAADAAAADATAAEAAASDSDWPMFRGDSKATGVARTELPEQLELLWRFTVPKGAFEGTPAIVDGVVYLGDLDGNFYALDLATGEKRWVQTFEAGFTASPSVRDGLLYIGDFYGQFYCLSTEDGTLVWQYDTEAEIDGSANFFQDRVLFGSQDATLYSLHAKTGELVWKHTVDDQIRCSPTIVEGRCFVAGCDGLLHIINVEDGQPIATVPIGSPTGVTPAAWGDKVFFGAENGTFLCVDWRKEELAWTFKDDRTQSFRSCPAVTDQRVVFGGRDRTVRALHPETGELVWRFSARQRVDSSPVIVGQRVFVAVGDGRIHALDLDSGEELWQYETGNGFTGSPAVADGKLVIADDRGIVYCFGSPASD